MQEIEKPNYYAILTADVRYDKRLKANEKLLYAEITALSNAKGYCYATNGYFAKLYEVSKTSISKWISNLQKVGYIKVTIKYKENSKEIEKRYINISTHPIEEKLNTPIEEKLNTPIEEKLIDNTTSFNTINNNKKVNQKNMENAERLAIYLLNNIKKVNDKFNKTHTTWIEDIDKMLRLDKYSVEEVKSIIDWIYSDNGKFWQSNILSGRKLREKSDQLIMLMKTTPTQQKPFTTGGKTGGNKNFIADFNKRYGVEQQLATETIKTIEVLEYEQK